MKLKLFLKAFDVLHKDLKAIYNILLCVYLIDGEKREDKIRQSLSDFDSSYTYAKADIEEEILKECKG